MILNKQEEYKDTMEKVLFSPLSEGNVKTNRAVPADFQLFCEMTACNL